MPERLSGACCEPPLSLHSGTAARSSSRPARSKHLEPVRTLAAVPPTMRSCPRLHLGEKPCDLVQPVLDFHRLCEDVIDGSQNQPGEIWHWTPRKTLKTPEIELKLGVCFHLWILMAQCLPNIASLRVGFAISQLACQALRTTYI